MTTDNKQRARDLVKAKLLVSEDADWLAAALDEAEARGRRAGLQEAAKKVRTRTDGKSHMIDRMYTVDAILALLDGGDE